MSHECSITKRSNNIFFLSFRNAEKKEKKNDKNKGFLLVDENVCEKALGNLEEPQEKNKKKVIL